MSKLYTRPGTTELLTADANAIDWDIAIHDKVDIKELRLVWASGVTTAETLTVTLDSNEGAAYDAALAAFTVPAGTTSVGIRDINGLVFGDTVTLTYTNTDKISIDGSYTLSTSEGDGGSGPRVYLNGVEVGATSQAELATIDSTTTSKRVQEIDPLDEHCPLVNLLDTTNLVAATNYYPAATGGSLSGVKDLGFSGKFIDADGTFTLTLQTTADEDSTNGDWVTVYFYDNKNNTVVNSLTVTNGTLTFDCSANGIGDKAFYRFVVVNDGATNTAILKAKTKAV